MLTTLSWGSGHGGLVSRTTRGCQSMFEQTKGFIGLFVFARHDLGCGVYTLHEQKLGTGIDDRLQ